MKIIENILLASIKKKDKNKSKVKEIDKFH